MREPAGAAGRYQTPSVRCPCAPIFALAVACMLLLGGCRSGDGARANVLLVTIDTLRADHLGCYGYQRATSPNLDSLAARSVRFSDAVSASSWTLPGHASLLTGLFPSQHGVQTDINALPSSAETLAERLAAGGYETFGAVSHVYLSRRWGFDQGFDEYDQRAAMASAHRPVAARVVDAVLEWLGGREARGSGDKPFFVWLHAFDPHWDYSPPAPYDTLFDPHYEGRMSGRYESLKPFIKEVVGYDSAPSIAQHDLDHVIALYDGEIAYVDAQLGRLFAGLRAAGLDDDTLIVVVSDHGEEFMEHGSLEGHQWTLYEEVVRVPLLLRPPARGCAYGEVPGGQVVDRAVSTVGISGTVLDCVGIESGLPSLTALLGGAGTSGPPAVDRVLLDLTVRRSRRSVALRTAQSKLIRHLDGASELYAKPRIGGETSADDLSERKPGEVAELAAELDAMLAKLPRLEDAGVERSIMDPVTTQRLRETGYLD